MLENLSQKNDSIGRLFISLIVLSLVVHFFIFFWFLPAKKNPLPTQFIEIDFISPQDLESKAQALPSKNKPVTKGLPKKIAKNLSAKKKTERPAKPISKPNVKKTKWQPNSKKIAPPPLKVIKPTLKIVGKTKTVVEHPLTNRSLKLNSKTSSLLNKPIIQDRSPNIQVSGATVIQPPKVTVPENDFIPEDYKPNFNINQKIEISQTNTIQVSPARVEEEQKTTVKQKKITENLLLVRQLLYKPPVPRLNIEDNSDIFLYFSVKPSGEVFDVIPEKKGNSLLEEAGMSYLRRFRFVSLPGKIIQHGRIRFVIRRGKLEN